MASSSSSAMKLSVMVGIVVTMMAVVAVAESRPHHGGNLMSIVGYAPEDLENHDRLIKLFEEWVSKYRKAYASFEEKLHRFEVFKDNLKHIDEINKQVTSYWLGLNAFADLTHDEFKTSYLGLHPPPQQPRRRSSSNSFDGEVPKSKGYIRMKRGTGKPEGLCGINKMASYPTKDPQ
ncbi:hypothetical protein PR202_gb25198 [Eleusine coracana subsp. coracana]|uniref:Cathepsin propeptide inhibitor domain-containing protein n=1 Tax=Eleusine coracana subsp. coracana TaxID=191504 RepID=A0AAV5FND1_ELECO|nr:hypothetical protein PR202_gb25198 [Eleusine coracana subsp. coracana]